MLSKATKTFLLTLWVLTVCALIIIALVLLRQFFSESGGFVYDRGKWRQTEPVETTYGVTLLFGSTDGQGLTREERKTRRRETFLEQVGEVLEELIRGPYSVSGRTIPPASKVNSIFLLPNKTLVVDFSSELQMLHTGGTTGEIFTVYSIVNTLTMNFREVEKVQILIDGDEVETLAGHLDLEQPLTQDSRWLKPFVTPPTPATEKPSA